ncbi:MAG: NFYB/HAP3 family transcription factor subunit [Candidatus Helarchaeota archaeon]|nr:NFYB/HAP3 family transcription factor subunit [Candidatus Helarchaeota archaeon]
MAKKRYFAWSPLRALMSSVGAKIVARDAVGYLIEWLQQKSIDLTQRALVLARHAKRKKVSKNDIGLAIKGF